MIVLQKKFSAGEKLPNENELATSLGVSRTTLREAVHYLIAQGILSVQRGRGNSRSGTAANIHCEAAHCQFHSKACGCQTSPDKKACAHCVQIQVCA